jgi:hypothetical protein
MAAGRQSGEEVGGTVSENNPVGGAPAPYYSDEQHPPGQRYWGTRWWLLTLAVLFVVVLIVAALGGRSGPSAKWLATSNYARTWSGSAGSVYYGIDLVNDTDTTMVVDSVTVVTDQGQALSEAAATQVTATVAAIDLTSTTSPVFTPEVTGWRPPPLPAQGFPIDGHGDKAVLVVTVHPQCPGLAIPATAKIVVGYHNTTQSFTLTAYELTGANNPLTALVQQACG